MNSIKCNGDFLHPSKVVCIGRNYVAHIEELKNEIPDEPVIFIKPNSAITNQITIPNDEEIHYESEISFLIRNQQISAVGFGLDLTKRTKQSELKTKGLPWERAKAFDRSAVFSEFKTISENIDDLRLELHINGELIQQGGCELMLFKPNDILNEVSSFLTLEDDDVIMTGTPSGVGKINSGDEFVGRIFSDNKLIVQQKWSIE